MKIIKNIINLKSKVSMSILSIIYSLLSLFGFSYMKVGNASLVFNNTFLSLVCFLIYFLSLRVVLVLITNKLDKYKTGLKKTSNRFLNLFINHPFLISIIIIILLWLPYIISFYPAILSKDPSYQIKQFFSIPNKYSGYSVLLDKGMLITNHHPVLHTLLLGSCLKLGNMIGNDNLGLFLYSVIQILVLSSVLSFTIKYMVKIKTPIKYIIFCLLIYGLVPMFPLYAISAVKDVIFTSLIILYIILIYHLVKNKEMILKKHQVLLILLLLIFIILFRNNGFHVILLSFPFLIFSNKTNLKKLLFIFIIILGFNYSYNNIVLPYFKITPGSIRETLSIPFQQTARYVKYHKDDLTSREYKTYDKILGIKTISKRYNPEKSDPVKSGFNIHTTNKDLKNYFKIWTLDLFKDPILYIDATINNTYGYFYPPKTNWYVYYECEDRINKDGFNYHYNNLEKHRNKLSKFAVIYPFIPIIGLISNIGFNTWILFFLTTYLIYRKKYRGLICLIPCYVVLLVCVASPVNSYFRYAMPYIFSMPVIFSMFMDCIGGKNEKK